MLANEFTWKTVVIIPIGKGCLQGIGLVEVLCKAVASLLNCQITSAITYHDELNRFWASWDMGTAALKYKLLQQLMAVSEDVLFEVFLDIQKAYNALDWERSLELLAEYRVSLRTLRLLRKYWDQLTMVDKDGRYSGRSFKG